MKKLLKNNSEYFRPIDNLVPNAVLYSLVETSFHIWTKSTTEYHAHENYFEIFIVTQGKLIHCFDDKQEILKARDMYIIFPGQYHQFKQYKQYTSQHINLTCTLSFAEKLFNLHFNSKKPNISPQHIHLTPHQFETISYFQNILLTQTDKDIFNNYLKSLFCYVTGIYLLNESIKNVEQPSWLTTFLHKLHGIDFSKKIPLTDIYKLSGYGQTALSKLFKQYMGQTLISYINDLKLDYACSLLTNTDYTTLSISSSLGFDSLSHFNHLFKKKFNMSPLQYRKAHLF